MCKWLYPGSFDPVTRGHMDIIARAAGLCDELIVAVMHNPDKRGALTVSQRMSALRAACSSLGNVRVIAHSGLLVECAKEYEISVVVRGVRPLGDFETEYQMAQVNRLIGGVETLLMPTSEELASISSSVVRQIAAFGGEIGGFVPQEAADMIREALAEGKG